MANTCSRSTRNVDFEPEQKMESIKELINKAGERARWNLCQVLFRVAELPFPWMVDSSPDALNKLLADFPYIQSFEVTTRDFQVHPQILPADLKNRPHLARWHRNIAELKNSLNSESKMVASTTEQVAQGGVENLPQMILETIDKSKEPLDSLQYAAQLKIDHQRVVGAIKSLQAHEGLIEVDEVSQKRLDLTAEGKEIAEGGSHEFKLFEHIGKDGAAQAELNIRKKDSVVDECCKQLNDLSLGGNVDDKIKAELKKRKLVAEVVIKGFRVRKGSNFSVTISKAEIDLTPDMITTGSWKTATFKKYNFDAMGVQPSCGHLHPLMKVRAEFRQIFFSMGFSEMQTNRYVESSFWNFDALFQPQQHPARDAHDTFFVSDPAAATQFPQDYLERVKTVHSKGGYGSSGYNYDWKLEEAQKNVLRTHTTAVSARQLYKLAQEGFKPARMFSIDRVFRNETLDATHLAEFHQVEGVIAERNLSLGHLIGVFTEFFKRMGIENLRFKPTYNPYTEPSMEIFAYHNGLKKWVEIGNSGMFRPEMLLPMGLPEDVNVAGYGLSLERPTMIRYGINNIRDLFGPKVDLQMIYDGPICRLDKD
ncbi:hypothetical protein WR25_25439 [Diploscapter pachys]|uniref:phenylalanine--tRNA ligase n=1 Tax=Diploscapter pachys TaxID=2018661 RepID=A0A2A2J2T5_9BILA|nr:hypothetical protein WR25_25439 [Diploscapter pachys]